MRETAIREHPECVNVIPSPDGVNIQKLGNHGVITTDTCNAAQKARRIMQLKIGGSTHEWDCLHHTRNVWIKGMEKAVTGRLRVVVTDSMEMIPSEL